MAVLFTDSFDHYSDANTMDKWTSHGAAGAFIITPAAGRCGTQAAFQNFVGLTTRGVTLHGGASTDRGFAGFAYKPVLIGTGLNFFSVGATGNSGVPHFRAAADPSGAINITNGAGSLV